MYPPAPQSLLRRQGWKSPTVQWQPLVLQAQTAATTVSVTYTSTKHQHVSVLNNYQNYNASPPTSIFKPHTQTYTTKTLKTITDTASKAVNKQMLNKSLHVISQLHKYVKGSPCANGCWTTFFKQNPLQNRGQTCSKYCEKCQTNMTEDGGTW